VNPRVGIASTRDGVNVAVGQVMALADCDGCVGRNAKVLVKPNLHGGEGYTSMAAIAAIVNWALDMGAGQVVVGDGPYYGMTETGSYFERIGLAELCRNLGATLVNFHDGEYDILNPNLPALPQVIGISKWVRWADVVISMPVMKTHFNTLTTLAIKNLKGFLRPQDKREIHKMDLHLAIAALAKIVQPHISIIDGSVAYEGMGPNDGRPVEMGLMLASSSAFSVDVVANWLMGFEPAKVRYLREAERLGCGRIPASDDELAQMVQCPAHYLKNLRRRFQEPYEAAEQNYPNLSISAALACSGCLMNLFTALKELAAEGLGSALRGTVAIGKPPGTVDLAVGNCTFAVWESAAHVEGCPPTINAIKQAMQPLAGASS
jgi:uncharacterized protein (DUF362 family)